MILSNSKLPFCVTGENVSNVNPLRNDRATAGMGRLFGGETVRPALGICLGCDGVATPAIVDQIALRRVKEANLVPN